MLKEENEKFQELIKSNYAAINPYAPEIKIEALRLWWVDLNDYPLEVIKKSFELYRKSGNDRFPTSGKIIEIINSHDGRPTPDEAYSIIKPIIYDEELSVLVTIEMQSAYPAAHGFGKDEYGARKAFIDVYTRLICESRRLKTPVKWILWMGNNKDLRAEAALKGLNAGKLTKSEVQKYLPSPTKENLQTTDLIRENINRSNNNMPLLESTKPIEGTREYFKKKIEELKNGLEYKNLEESVNNLKPKIEKTSRKPVRILEENIIPIDKWIIKSQCSKPQPAGTLSIGVDGKPEKGINE